MGAAWELERLASREGGSAKVVSGATRDFGTTRRQERPYSGFAFWQSPVSLSNVKAAVSVERSACAKRARPWVGAQQRPVLRPVNNTAPRHLRSVRGGWLRQQRNRELKKGLAPFTPCIDLALQCRWERCSLLSTCGQKKKTCSAFQGVSQMGRPPGVTLSTPADLVAASRHRGQRFHPATRPVYRSPRCPSPFLAPRSRPGRPQGNGSCLGIGTPRKPRRGFREGGFAFWQSPVSLSNVKAAVSVERSACAKRARPWVGAQQRPVLRPVNNTAPRHLRSVRGGWLRQQRNRELKKGLAPFTPRIDLALQCRWERCSLLSTCGQKKKTCSAFQGVSQMGRPPGVTLSTPADLVAASRHRGQRFHPATGPVYRSPRCPSPFLAPRSRSASS
ncbi:hypothetical protein Q8A73_016854 [Channa argus]|nr:hypothetical protein Q8A73_016854 [Channa argus]